MNKYEFSTKQLTLSKWEKEAINARIKVILAIKTMEAIEKKIEELKEGD